MTCMRENEPGLARVALQSMVLGGSMFLLAQPIATAQEMGQGEANITARAEVRMSLESGPATSSQKLALIGGVVGGTLEAVRTCYRTVTETNPEVQGRLQLIIDLTGRGGQVEIHRNELNHEQLQRCALRALRGANFEMVRPPGSAFVTLTFNNTAAEGVGRTRALRAEEDHATITRNADGHMTTSGGTEIGEVRFRLEGNERTTEAQIQAVHSALRTAIPTFLDCRRKAARRESPYGEVQIDLVIRRGRAQARTRRSTVADDRGQRCLTRGLQRTRFGNEANGRIRLVVEFRPRPGDIAPPPR